MESILRYIVMTLGKKVAFNTIVQIIGRVLGLLIMLVTINYIANHLIVGGSALAGFGQYTIVFAYVSIIGVIADLGVFTLLVRDIAGKTREEVGELVGSALGFRFLLLFLTIFLAIGLYRFMPYTEAVRIGIILGILIAFSLLFSQIIAAVFQAHLVPHRIVVAETIGRVIIMLITIYVLGQGMGLIAVVMAHLIGYLITFGISYWLALEFTPLPLRFNLALWRDTLPQFWPLAIISLLSLIHFKIDSVILSLYKSEADVGIYGIAYKLIEIVIIIPTIFASNLLPIFANVYDEGRKEDFLRILKRASSVLVLLGLFISLVMYLLAPWLIVFISQMEFIAAVQPLRILIFAILLVFLGNLLLQAVISARYQKKLLWTYSITVVLNIALNIYAIPRYSYIGAAVTTVITEIILVAAIMTVAYKQLRFRLDWGMFGRTFLTTIIVGSGLFWLYNVTVMPIDQFAAAGKLIQLFYLGLALVPIVGLYGVVLWIVSGGSFSKIKELIRI